MTARLDRHSSLVIAGATASPNANFAVARLLADGTVDTEFTDTGVMEIDFFGFTDIAESVAVTDDGKIVVAGLARDNVDGYRVARLSRQDTGPTGSQGRPVPPRRPAGGTRPLRRP